MIDFLTRHFIPLMLAGWLGLSVLFCPLQFMVMSRLARPADPQAFNRGAVAMCMQFAARAGVAASEAGPVCAEMAASVTE